MSPVILVYHAIGRAPANVALHNSFVPVEVFTRQMAHAQRAGDVVPLDVLVDASVDGPPSSRRKIAITFDDGYRTAFTHAVPVLERLGLPATFFIPTRHIGRRNAWDGPSELDLDIMTEDEIIDLDRRGFEIGSHGHAHVDLSDVDDVEARSDITTSVDILTSILGRRPRFLAFPYGRSTGAVQAFVADHFSAALAMEKGGGRFAMTRTPVYPRDRRALFALKASGRYSRWRHTPLVAGTYAAVRPLVRRGQQ